MIAFLVAIGLLPAPSCAPPPGPVMMLATNFDVPERDRWNPRRGLACGGEIDRTTPIVAHRTLPCGARLLIYAPRTGRATVAEVRDRGPYGRNRDGIDLSPAAARALRANGMEPVIVVVLSESPSLNALALTR